MLYSISQTHRRIIRNVALPIMGIIALMICIVIALVVYLAQRQTDDALERQRELARGMIDVRLSELAKVVDDYAHWDEALVNLAIRPNPAWAENNIGRTMKARFGVDATFVVDSEGETSYAMSNGVQGPIPVNRVMSFGFDEILLERAAGGPDAVASGIAFADGHPALVAIAPIRPSDYIVDETRDRRSVLAFVDLLDGAELKRLSEIYRLPDLHVESGMSEPPASVVVTTSDGRVPVRLAWIGDDPGERMLKHLLPPLLALLATFAALILLTLHQMTRLLTDLRRTEERASRDPLTQLFNRSILMQDLDRMTDPKTDFRPHTLLYLDLDGFKDVNDRLGHEVGDKVLRETASRISQALPEIATAYRIGGDEFAILITGDDDVSVIGGIGAGIIVAVSRPLMIEDRLVRVGATIGVAKAPRDRRDPVEIIRHADEALYMGKREGKGCIRFYVDMLSRDGLPEPRELAEAG